MSIIANISTALPTYKHRQTVLADFVFELFNYSAPKKKKLLLMISKSGIRYRYSVMPDFSSKKEDRLFFPKTSDLEPFPDIGYRMQYFNKPALQLCTDAIEKCIKGKVLNSQVTHLITVSCTGLSAPGLDIDIVQSLKLNSNINRTSVNFMGCYAAIHALKQADYICKSDPDAVVVVVCVELCTLHFQKAETLDNTVANLLFGDGCASALVVSDNVASENKFKGFEIKKFHSQIDLNGKRDMTWQLSSTGFLMSLSSYIPELIEKGFKTLFQDSIDKLSIKKQDINHWAVHPGGRKILEVIQQELELKDGDLDSSYSVLKNYGNMSSPTVLFVLKDILDKKIHPDKRELTYAVAFGPGLTMESLILENV